LVARIAEAIAQRVGALALVTGESLGQVASQTLENLARTTEVVGMPVLRPLIGTDKEEIIREARAIGTYEISIEPDQDCCTLFVPKHPETRADAGSVQAAEGRLDVTRLVEAGVSGALSRTFRFPRLGGGAAADGGPVRARGRSEPSRRRLSPGLPVSREPDPLGGRIAVHAVRHEGARVGAKRVPADRDQQALLPPT